MRSGHDGRSLAPTGSSCNNAPLAMVAALRQRLRALVRRQAVSDYLNGVCYPFLGQRTVLLVVVYFASFFIPMGYVAWQALPQAPFFDGWLRWDSYYYLLIASEGYGRTEWGNPDCFFPLYAWLIRLLAPLLSAPVAALVLAHVATLVGLGLLYAIARRLYDPTLAQRAVWAALLFPSAYFFAAGYSESTYFACATGAYLAWLHRRHRLAIGLAAAATLARPVGALCFTLPFLVGWLLERDRRVPPWIVLGPVIGGAVLGLTHTLSSGTPLAVFQVAYDDLFGDPMGFQRSAAPWWEVLVDEGIGLPLMLRLLNWSAMAVVAGATVALLRRREIELGLIALLSVALPAVVQRSLFDTMSFARFALSAFPLFFVLARWGGDGNRARVLGVACVALQICLALCFFTWRWAE